MMRVYLLKGKRKNHFETHLFLSVVDFGDVRKKNDVVGSAYIPTISISIRRLISICHSA